MQLCLHIQLIVDAPEGVLLTIRPGFLLVCRAPEKVLACIMAGSSRDHPLQLRKSSGGLEQQWLLTPNGIVNARWRAMVRVCCASSNAIGLGLCHVMHDIERHCAARAWGPPLHAQACIKRKVVCNHRS